MLILAPLAVASQTVREAAKFSIQDVAYCRDQSQVSGKITIANYEMLDHFDPSEFGGIVLDESSILKAYDGKFRNQIISSFHETPYRLACTATPAPNDLMELTNHSEFLGTMGRKFIGAELKRSYWQQACANLGRAARQESLELFAGEPDPVSAE